jgi:predicted phage terminase large subunit-like protein
LPERFDRIVQSWDTANKASELSDFSVCTTWGLKGKHLYLLGVLRQRLEYPALKRAVREQHSLFDANVVLIEDNASGTQLIQELIADGFHRVTRYKPEGDKIMRLHAQTGIIENGFVHFPHTAPWLAEYVHELTVFPDWFKKPFSHQGIYEYYRQLADAEQHAKSQPTQTEWARGSMEWLVMSQIELNRATSAPKPATHDTCRGRPRVRISLPPAVS